MMRRDKEHKVNRVLMTDTPGRRQTGRPQTRWNDACERDMNTAGLGAVEVINRATWKKKITPATPHEREKNAVEMIIV